MEILRRVVAPALFALTVHCGGNPQKIAAPEKNFSAAGKTRILTHLALQASLAHDYGKLLKAPEETAQGQAILACSKQNPAWRIDKKKADEAMKKLAEGTNFETCDPHGDGEAPARICEVKELAAKNCPNDVMHAYRNLLAPLLKLAACADLEQGQSPTFHGTIKPPKIRIVAQTRQPHEVSKSGINAIIDKNSEIRIAVEPNTGYQDVWDEKDRTRIFTEKKVQIKSTYVEVPANISQEIELVTIVDEFEGEIQLSRDKKKEIRGIDQASLQNWWPASCQNINNQLDTSNVQPPLQSPPSPDAELAIGLSKAYEFTITFATEDIEKEEGGRQKIQTCLDQAAVSLQPADRKIFDKERASAHPANSLWWLKSEISPNSLWKFAETYMDCLKPLLQPTQ